MKNFLLAITLTAGILILLPTHKAGAVTVSPVRTELSVDPGQSVDAKIKLFNESASRQTFYIVFANFESKDETGEPTFVPGNKGIPSWVQAPSSIDIEPKQYSEVTFTITPPKNVDPGGYFAAALASKSAPSADGLNPISLETQTGTLIFLKVNGDFAEGEKIIEFNTKDKQALFNSLPVEFFYRFQNSGADRIKPAGDITIKSIFGWQSKIINANPTGGSALPQSIRRFEASWSTSGGGIEEQPINPNRLKNKASFKEAVVWQWQHFAVGLEHGGQSS
jgi:hypothetical protein